MTNRSIAAAIAAVCIASNVAYAASAPRISGFQRCGDLLDNRHFEFCVDVSNGGSGETKLLLNGKQLATHSRGEKSLRFKVDWSQHVSGAFWVEQGKMRSNAVWLSLQDSATVAAEDDEVTRNAKGITTFIDLVSIIIEEEFDALQEARRMAKKYDAHVVGSIPPLRIYQLRLPVNDLDHRDALVLRLDGEESIDRVMIEESSPEDDGEQDEKKEQAQSASRMNEVAANRFMDAVDYYRRRVPGPAAARIKPAAQRLGVIERALDFDSPDFTGLTNPEPGAVRLYGRDAENPNGHGSTVAGVLAASWNDGGNSGFLSGLDGHHGGIDIIVDRGSDAGIVAHVATSVRLVQDGARVLNWSWGMHRVGAERADGKDIDSVVRSGVAFEGYEELLEEFFLWLRKEHPQVIVVNSAGNAGAFTNNDDYRLPSSFVTPQLLVVGAHQRTGKPVPVDNPLYVKSRGASNIGTRVNITAAACVPGAAANKDKNGENAELLCGTSYATALVSGLVTAMLSINPELMPEEIIELLRRASMPAGTEINFEPADAEELSAPILPSERAERLDHPDVGRSARLDMHKALQLSVDSLRH